MALVKECKKLKLKGSNMGELNKLLIDGTLFGSVRIFFDPTLQIYR